MAFWAEESCLSRGGDTLGRFRVRRVLWTRGTVRTGAAKAMEIAAGWRQVAKRFLF